MPEERVYLELSEASSHKFYEVLIKDTELTIRYGRIGDGGQTQTKAFPSFEKAKAEADKKVREKKSKGYEEAVQGVRQKRAVTRRSAAVAQASRAPRPVGVKSAPVLWRFQSGASALGIFVDKEKLLVGNEAGTIYCLSMSDRTTLAHYQLPDGVKCIVADGGWIYAGCDDGKVYDLTGKVPRAAYTIAENVDIYWLDIRDGILAVSDAEGNVAVFNQEEETQWRKKSAGDKAWMVRCDEIGVYHGHSRGVTMYDWDGGTELWTRPTTDWIGFGWQEEAEVFASTAAGTIHRFSKKGDVGVVYRCDAFLCSCAASPDGKYVFGGDSYGYIYCFDAAGARLWKLDGGCGAAQSMQYFEEKLYIVTNNGFLACLDVSEAAIAAAGSGQVPVASVVAAGAIKAVETKTEVERTQDVGSGVLVECVEEGGKLRVKVLSEGFNKDWHCQFPRDLREKGARFVVAEVVAAERGEFYRVRGEIKRLG
jgi:predicted DNA-binding WGR domain protein